MLKVYAADWCPHCVKTIEYLNANNIPHEKIYIEELAPEQVQKVIEVNGGDDWVIPTLEFNGNWREGKVFNPDTLPSDLSILGVI